MKGLNKTFIILTVFTATFSFSQVTYRNRDTLSLGDINNDYIPDTAFVIGPEYPSSESDLWDCNICSTRIEFSSGLPHIELEDAVGATIEKIGDINEDGVNEVIVVPWWFAGCWGRIYFYTLQNNTWLLFGNARCNTCSDV